MAHVINIADLRVEFDTMDGIVQAVRGVNCHVNSSECLGIVGESGSGKSQTFLAALGLLASNGRTRGTIEFKGQNLVNLPEHSLSHIRGNDISMIFQDPLTSLTPHMRIGEQMREVLRTHKNLSGSDAEKRCVQWLDHVHIPEAKRRLRQYPHELSGGMRQRIMIAMAMLCGPALLIADEPTTALDVTIQAEILDLMDELRREEGTAIVLITHDMGVVARMCDRIQVMRNGEFVEDGTADNIFYNPEHNYTKMLLSAVPRLDLSSSERLPISALNKNQRSADLLRVKDVEVHFKLSNGLLRRASTLRAVNGVSFDLAPGETLGVVGESGSGKSTLARAVLQLIPPSAGTVSWLGTDLQSLKPDALKATRQDLQIVFQDPMASLNPSMTVGESIMEPLTVFEKNLTRQQRTHRVAQMMERVGLDHTLINRYPHELSGGQNQRVGIARATILKPRLVICDEAVSALDVSIQAQILILLKDLQREFDLSYIFISHDLSVVWEMSHRILVMYLGSIVEMADRDQLFNDPQHPYTQQLISAVPVPDPDLERARQRIRLKGELSSPLDPAARLRFLPSRLNKRDSNYVPRLEQRFPGHYVAEHDPLEQLLSDEYKSGND